MPQLANKVVITCAITGSIHTPTMSDALPITPDQIATQSIDAAKAGAAILHLHARAPKDGRPSPDPEIFPLERRVVFADRGTPPGRPETK